MKEFGMTTFPPNESASDQNSASAREYDIAYLGAPPLVPGEDAAAYDRLLASVIDTVKPQDVMEVIWVREYTDETWDILRYRRASARLIEAGKAQALADTLRWAMINDTEFQYFPQLADELASKWSQGDPAAIEKIKTLLAPSALTEDALNAQAVSRKLDDIERLDRMVLTKEVRRDKALREIDLHRVSFSVQTRRIAKQLTGEGYSVI
jgi:hypothetical protein